jgi:hypothetical protein
MVYKRRWQVKIDEVEVERSDAQTRPDNEGMLIIAVVLMPS